jgi:hypothetical protein
MRDGRIHGDGGRDDGPLEQSEAGHRVIARYEVFDFGDETGDNSTVDFGQIQLQQHLSGGMHSAAKLTAVEPKEFGWFGRSSK